MIITKIQQLRGKKSRYSIYLDGSPSLELSDWTIGKYGIRKGDDLSDNSIAKILSTETETRAKNIAINYLSYRKRSSQEVIDHLIKKKFDRVCAEKIVRDLQSAGIINDLEFAHVFIRDRLKRKLIGQAQLRQQLLTKGITSDIADKLLGELISPNSQQTAALELAKRKFRLLHRSVSKLNSEKKKKRILSLLLRRGFSYEIAIKAVRNTIGN